MNEPAVYLDNNATTPLAPEVLQTMSRVMRDHYGNPSSSHIVGQQAAHCVAQARRQVAAALAARPDEIIFTSGGTESDNLAIRGVLEASRHKRHVVTTAIEHEAVLRLAESLRGSGHEVTILAVDDQGQLDLAALRSALRDDTALCSVMLANNETGVLMPLKQIASACRQRGVPVHSDAVQAVGKIPTDVGDLGVDLLSLSAHKFHGPEGVGALYVRAGQNLRPQIIGGHQERDLRGGTENVAGLAGLGAAAELASRGLQAQANQVQALRDRLERDICKHVPEAIVIGAGALRLPNTACIAFAGFVSERILIGLSERGICVSAGAACHSGSLEPSRVLSAMGIPAHVALGAVRLSLSRYTATVDVDRAVQAIVGVVDSLRGSAAYACPAAGRPK